MPPLGQDCYWKTSELPEALLFTRICVIIESATQAGTVSGFALYIF